MIQGYKTYLGIVIAMAPSIANLFGFELAPGFDAEFSTAVDSLVTLIGSALALYGRLVAQTPGWLAKR